MVIDSGLATGSLSVSGSYIQTGNAKVSGSVTITGSLNVTDTITATTLIVQTITASVEVVTGSLTVSGSLMALGGVTGSLLGTASWAINTLTSSYASASTSASYASSSTTASYALNATSASYALNTVSASYAVFATSASYASASTSASYANNTTSASYANIATSASYASASTSASYASASTSASYALFATSASYAQNATSASYTLFTTSASYASASTSASYASASTSASYAAFATSASYALFAASSSYASASTSSSYASASTSASYALDAISASYALFATNASYASASNSASYASSSKSSSYALTSTSASYAVFATSASYSLTSTSASYALNATTAQTASYANNFTVAGTLTAQTIVVQTITSSISVVTGSMTVSGALVVLGGITGSLNGTASWANNATSASYALNATSASYAQNATSASYSLNSTSASYALNATSASFAPTATNVYIQGGNSFGAQAVLGTNDTQNLAFETNGTVRMTITGSDGNVGIGTTTPSYKLDVSGTGRFAASYTASGTVAIETWQRVGGAVSADMTYNDANTSMNFGTSTAHALNLKTNNTTALSIISGGSVGIGLTNPGYKFEVKASDIGNWIAGAYNTAATDGQAFIARIGGNGQYAYLGAYRDGVGYDFWIKGDGTSYFGGSVGIGTTSPTSLLHLNSSGTTNLYIQSGTGNEAVIRYFSGTTEVATARANSSGSYFIETGVGSPTEKIRITSGGSVGIGTTSPIYTLDVTGTGRFSSNLSTFGQLRLEPSAGGSVVVGSRSSQIDFQLYNTGNVFRIYDGSRDALNVTTSGIVGIGTTNPLGLFEVKGDGVSYFTRGTKSILLNPNVVGADTEALIEVSSGMALTFGTGGSERIRITSGGNVGIGTTAPVSRLQSNNSSTYNSSTPNGAIIASNLAGGNAVVDIGVDAAYLGYIQSRNITNTTVYNLLLNPVGGNVGIGTISPSSVLHVNAGAVSTPRGSGFSKFFFTGNNATTTYFEIQTPSGSTGDILFSDGASGDYGIVGYDHATDSMRFYTKSAINMFISSSGNVGIGTTTPSVTLQVDASGGGLIRATRTGAGSGYIQMEADGTNGTLTANNTLYFNAGGSARMTILSGGNVGIGTTSPGSILHIVGGLTVGANTNYTNVRFENSASIGSYNGTHVIYPTTVPGSGTAQHLTYFKTNGSPGAQTVHNVSIDGNVAIGTTSAFSRLTINGQLSQETSQISLINSEGGHYIIRTGIAGIANQGLVFLSANQDGTGQTSRLVIDSSGKVGIGTTSPLGNLDVSTSSNTAINITAGSTSLSRLIFGTTSGNNRGFIDYDNTSSVRAMLFRTDEAERMRITSGGIVYINTTTNPTPDNAAPQFGILAGTGTDAINIKHTQNANNSINIWQTGTTSHNAIAFYKGDTQTNRGLITVTTSGTTYNSVSDYRLKTNVVPLENGLDRLMQLKPSKFNWIESGEEAEGFIAHELQEIFPDAVTGEKDAVYSSTGNIKPQSVDYGRITPLLVKAIQELTARVKELESRL